MTITASELKRLKATPASDAYESYLPDEPGLSLDDADSLIGDTGMPTGTGVNNLAMPGLAQHGSTEVCALNDEYDLNFERAAHLMGVRFNESRNWKTRTVNTNQKGLKLLVRVNQFGDEYRVFLAEDRSAVKAFILPSGKTAAPLVAYARFLTPPELPHQLTRIVFEPHSLVVDRYRGRGFMRTIYSWFLDSGHCLISTSSHTKDAGKMWDWLASKYKRVFVNVWSQKQVKENRSDDDNVRALLIGRSVNKNRVLDAYKE